MRSLVTSGDGIEAGAVWALASAMAGVARVVAVLPGEATAGEAQSSSSVALLLEPEATPNAESGLERVLLIDGSVASRIAMAQRYCSPAIFDLVVVAADRLSLERSTRSLPDVLSGARFAQLAGTTAVLTSLDVGSSPDAMTSWEVAAAVTCRVAQTLRREHWPAVVIDLVVPQLETLSQLNGVIARKDAGSAGRYLSGEPRKDSWALANHFASLNVLTAPDEKFAPDLATFSRTVMHA
jgi:broad specificity polyphosphatase/5'/3'-nucleotidase SurE